MPHIDCVRYLNSFLRALYGAFTRVLLEANVVVEYLRVLLGKRVDRLLIFPGGDFSSRLSLAQHRLKKIVEFTAMNAVARSRWKNLEEARRSLEAELDTLEREMR